jgi:hypothetical protein
VEFRAGFVICLPTVRLSAAVKHGRQISAIDQGPESEPALSAEAEPDALFEEASEPPTISAGEKG